MATEKILQTRILNKVATLEAWNSSTLKIKNGEICFATVAASAGTGLTEPVVMAKIGTSEEKTFSELPWSFYAKASDVLAACKSEESLKAFVNGVIADAGIASSEAMEALAGKVTTAEGKITTLEGEMDAVEGKAAANETAITALQGLVGDSKVADQISTAIANLKLADTYAAKSLETTVADHVADTVAHVTTADKTKWNGALQASDIAAGSANGTIAVKGTDIAITGLGSAAFTESTAYDAHGSAASAESNAKAYAKEYADGLAGNYDAAGSAATAESNAKAYAKEYADGLAGNYDAAGSAATAEQNAKDYTDSEMTRLVGDTKVATQITNAITGLDLANTYAAKAHTHVKADITDFAHTHEISEVNGLQDALDGKQAAGDYETKTDAAAKLTEAKGYTDTEVAKVQGEVDTLEEYVGTIPEGATATNIVAYVQEKTSGIATDAALSELTNRVGDAESAIDAIEADYLKAADKTALQDQITANDGEIAALQGLVGDKNVSEQITDVTDPLAARVKAVEDDYLKAADKTALQEQITTNANAIERLTNGVSAEEVDGVNDLIQYVKDHGTEVTGMKGDIKANADAIDAIEKDYLVEADKTELQGNIDTLAGRVTTVEGAVATKAEADDLEALDGRVEVVEGKVSTLEGEMDQAQADIDALEGLVGGTAVSTQIQTAITNANLGQYALAADLDVAEGKIEVLEGKAHEHANKAELDKFVDGDKAKLDAAVQTVTAGTGLTATKTGTDIAIDIDESVTWIFDCGGAV